MIIDTILKIDTASFQTGMGKSVQMVQSFIQIGQGIAAKFKAAGAETIKAFDLGGQLSDVSAQIGETAGEVLVLRRVLDDAGVGGENLTQIMGVMRKSMAGVDEQGNSTAKAFQALGLDVDALKNMGAVQQFETIGAAINSLPNPTERAAAAMSIFGRSGSRMLTVFADSSAFANARNSLGGIVEVMDRAAPAFDAISDKVGHIKEKSMGFWAGFAEGVLPAAESISNALDGIDLSGLGKRFGDVVSTWVEMLRSNELGEIMQLQLIVGWQKSVDGIVSGVERLSNQMVKWFGAPLIYFRSSFQKIIEEVLGLVAKIPKLNAIMGLEGFKANSFAAILRDQTDLALDAQKYGPSVQVYGNTAEQKQLAAAWQKASIAVAVQQKAIEEKAAATKPMGSAAPTTPIAAPERFTKAATLATDQFSRLGLFVGGGSVQQSLLRSSQNQEGFLKKIENNTAKFLGMNTGVAVYG